MIVIDRDLLTDFFLFFFIGAGVAFFQTFIMKRVFPGRFIMPLFISLMGSFTGSLMGSFFLGTLSFGSLWVLSVAALSLSLIFLQIYYNLSRVKDYY